MPSAQQRCAPASTAHPRSRTAPQPTARRTPGSSIVSPLGTHCTDARWFTQCALASRLVGPRRRRSTRASERIAGQAAPGAAQRRPRPPHWAPPAAPTHTQPLPCPHHWPSLSGEVAPVAAERGVRGPIELACARAVGQRTQLDDAHGAAALRRRHPHVHARTGGEFVRCHGWVENFQNKGGYAPSSAVDSGVHKQ